MPDVQEQGRAADVARVLHPEGQRMVRDRLREEEHAEQHGVGFIGVGDNTCGKRRHDVVERYVVEGGERVEAGSRIQVVVV